LRGPSPDVHQALTAGWSFRVVDDQHARRKQRRRSDPIPFWIRRLRHAGGFDIKVVELQPAERVLWQVVSGPEEWIGTKVSWELRREGEYTIVPFKHHGRKEPVEFMHHRSTKWGAFG
jgi:hypothetical protein